MKRILLILLIVSIFKVTVSAQNAERYPIIPQPLKLMEKKGSFEINSNTLLINGEKLNKTTIHAFNELIKLYTGTTLNVESSKINQFNSILFNIEDHTIKPESYRLDISPQKIKINSSDEIGAFYAMQSLMQLIQTSDDVKKGKRKILVPAVLIEDSPAYGYRGLLLDLARYYMPLSAVKKYIDLMASYKMNNLHLHLTDDQGWRIEIKKYPRLQEIGAWRKESIVGHKNDTPRVYDGKRHGGFYTQNELRDLVEYAKERYINIIPEVDMPGHATAALAAYPQLGCLKQGYEVSTAWSIHKDVFCTNEYTFQFLEDVLSEVIDIFPSNIIHIGGDESPRDRWKDCKECQDTIKERGLKNEDELQNYFVSRVSTFLESKGKTAICWDWEGAHTSVEPNKAIIMSWQGEEAGIAAAKRKEYTIMTPHLYTYLDYYQTEGKIKSEPLSISEERVLSIEKVYSYQPTPSILTSEESNYILGVQACLWGEYTSSEEVADFKLFPRFIAMSEVAWTSKENRDYESFNKRLKRNKILLDNKGVNYRKF